MDYATNIDKKENDWRDRRGHRELEARTLLARRALALRGGPNFRDLGGLAGAKGKRIAAGRFFRGDELGRLTDADLASLDALGIRTVIDFRTAAEAEDLPDRVPGSVTERHRLSIVPGNLEGTYAGGIDTFEAMETFVLQVYENLATDPGTLDSYRRFFACVRDEAALPLLFHCAAGKDRTGLAAAFLLFALGVEREAVLADYLASNICLERKYGDLVGKHPEMEPGFFVHRAYLETALAAVERDYGTVEAFLAGRLDVDLDGLRAKHLE